MEMVVTDMHRRGVTVFDSLECQSHGTGEFVLVTCQRTQLKFLHNFCSALISLPGSHQTRQSSLKLYEDQ